MRVAIVCMLLVLKCGFAISQNQNVQDTVSNNEKQQPDSERYKLDSMKRAVDSITKAYSDSIAGTHKTPDAQKNNISLKTFLTEEEKRLEEQKRWQWITGILLMITAISFAIIKGRKKS
ncbi:MAG: hypothetical protein ABJA79_04550 [Parafilimonas sp.]